MLSPSQSIAVIPRADGPLNRRRYRDRGQAHGHRQGLAITGRADERRSSSALSSRKETSCPDEAVGHSAAPYSRRCTWDTPAQYAPGLAVHVDGLGAVSDRESRPNFVSVADEFCLGGPMDHAKVRVVKLLARPAPVAPSVARRDTDCVPDAVRPGGRRRTPFVPGMTGREIGSTRSP
jgi:hypothetical protein